MRTVKLCFMVGVFLLASVTASQGAVIELYGWGLYLDGTIYPDAGALPGNVNASGFNWTTGLGTLTVSLTSAEAHNVIFYVDHEIDQTYNTWYNEYGAETGSLETGQSWEIDEPEYVYGNIYTNFSNGKLDNSNGVPITFPDDVSMALGWNFTLNPGFIANISYTVAYAQPTGIFYLTQTDPDSLVTDPSSQASIYFWSDLAVRPQDVPPIPEPTTMVLMGTGIAGLLGWKKRQRKNG